ncbi:hypothetical protein BKA69DRAFT_1037194 [Paraphysoderma sedebokerense]|nr:hypothetical protein BKA69DRAFT_1037194 [Paraphysoderma sedebokerense]
MRPSFRRRPNQSEEDLLKEQEEFIQKGQKPSVQVIRRSNPSTTHNGNHGDPTQPAHKNDKDIVSTPLQAPHQTTSEPQKSKKKSLFALRREELRRAQSSQQVLPSSSKNQPLVAGITDSSSTKTVPWPYQSSASGFPEAKHRSDDIAVNMGGPPESARPLDLGATFQREFAAKEVDDVNFYVHKENLEKLQKMSVAEVIEAQNQLVAQLDSSTLEFLRKRAKSKYSSSPTCTPSSDAADTQNSSPSAAAGVYSEDDPLAIHQKYFPQEPIEYEKLRWTGISPIDEALTPPSQPIDSSNLQYQRLDADDPLYLAQNHTASSLRFDFEGNIIEASNSVPVHVGLHHHGDDPSRAGYTLPELLHLVRSRVPSQRALSIRIIGCVLGNARRAMYEDRRLNSSIMNLFLELRGPVYIRGAIDDTNLTVLIDAVNCLGELVIDDDSGLTVDLHDLFRLQNRGYERLSPLREADAGGGAQRDDDDDDTIIAHSKLCTKDLILGLLKMDIHPRIHYIFNVCHLPHSSNNLLLKLLIVIAKNHPSCSGAIFQTAGILDVIDKHLIVSWPSPSSPTDTSEWIERCTSAVLVVKLLSILSQSSVEIANRISGLPNVESLIRYLMIDNNDSPLKFRIVGTRLQIEILIFYHILFVYGRSCHLFVNIQPYLLQYISSLAVSVWPLSTFVAYDAPNLESATNNQLLDLKIAKVTAVFRLLQTVVCLSSEGHRTNPPHSLSWFHVQPFLSPALTVASCLVDQMKKCHYSSNYPNHTTSLSLLNSVLDFIATYQRYHQNQSQSIQHDPSNDFLTISSLASYSLATLIDERLQSELSSLMHKLSSSLSSNVRSSSTFSLSNNPGLHTFQQIELAETFMSISILIGFVHSILKLANELPYQQSFEIISSSAVKNVVRMLLKSYPAIEWTLSDSWISFFGVQVGRFLMEWCLCVDETLMAKYVLDMDSSQSNRVQIDGGSDSLIETSDLRMLSCAAGLKGISSSFSGDENIVMDTIQKVVLSLSYIKELIRSEEKLHHLLEDPNLDSSINDVVSTYCAFINPRLIDSSKNLIELVSPKITSLFHEPTTIPTSSFTLWPISAHLTSTSSSSSSLSTDKVFAILTLTYLYHHTLPNLTSLTLPRPHIKSIYHLFYNTDIYTAPSLCSMFFHLLQVFNTELLKSDYQDFRNLIDEFSSNSYNNELFLWYLTIPILNPKTSVDVKVLFWNAVAEGYICFGRIVKRDLIAELQDLVKKEDWSIGVTKGAVDEGEKLHEELVEAVVKVLCGGFVRKDSGGGVSGLYEMLVAWVGQVARSTNSETEDEKKKRDWIARLKCNQELWSDLVKV